MKVFQKALVVAALCVSMALGLTACGKEALDGSQVVATVGEKEMTQRELAKELNISRSYVSRIEKRALEKLKEDFFKAYK